VSGKKGIDSILAVTSTDLDNFSVFGVNYTDNPRDWKIVKCPINTCTTLRKDDVIMTSLKNAVFARKPCPERTDRQYFGHDFDKFKYIVVIFCKKYHERNAKLLT